MSIIRNNTSIIRNNVISKVRNNIKKYNMIQEGDVVCIGLSGGADSMTLLTILNELKDEFHFTIVAAHVNHGIREEAGNDANFCRKICRNMNIPYYEKCVKVKELAKEMKMSEEEAGREIRYSFFRELGTKIATAHNKNDNVETLFMRLVRGTGLAGLTGISYVNGNIIRPLLSVSREEIESFVEDQEISYVTDKTNFQDVYTRNKIRLKIIPYLKENLNANLINTVGDNIQQFTEDEDCLFSMASEFVKKLNVSTSAVISISEFSKQHKAIQNRIIIQILSKIKNQKANVASRKNVEDILSLMEKPSGKKIILGNIVCYRDNKDLHIERKVEIEPIKIQVERVKTEQPISNNGFVCYIPDYYDFSKFKLRERKAGDVVRIDDTKHKRLTDFLSDKKVPITEREHIQVLAYENEVFMIPKYFGTRFEKRTGTFTKIEVK